MKRSYQKVPILGLPGGLNTSVGASFYDTQNIYLHIIIEAIQRETGVLLTSRMRAGCWRPEIKPRKQGGGTSWQL